MVFEIRNPASILLMTYVHSCIHRLGPSYNSCRLSSNILLQAAYFAKALLAVNNLSPNESNFIIQMTALQRGGTGNEKATSVLRVLLVAFRSLSNADIVGASSGSFRGLP